jgi:glycosyltransferase involved in cell wall biosynthesis
MKKRIFLFTNQVPNYREPLFLSLSANYDLTIMFYQLTKKDYSIVRRLKDNRAKVYTRPNLAQAILAIQSSILGIISADYLSWQCWLLLIISRIIGLPTLLWSEVWDWPSTGFGAIRSLIRRIALTLMSHLGSEFIVPGTLHRSFLINCGVERRKIHMVPNASNMNSNVNQEVEIPFEILTVPQKFVILYLARMEKMKGPDILIRAFSKFKERNDLLLIMGGTGSLLAQCKRLSKELGISNILFMGYVPERMKPSLYNIASVYVLPSRYDPYAISVIEAMYMGKPILVSDGVGCYPDAVQGNGFIFRHDDPNDLYNKICIMLQSDKVKLGTRSKLLARNFSMANMIANFFRAIEDTGRDYCDDWI